MIFKIIDRKALIIFSIILIVPLIIFSTISYKNNAVSTFNNDTPKKDFIKYAEFNVTLEALDKAMKIDIASHEKEIKINWIELLAHLGAKYGGDFKNKYKPKDMDNLVKEINTGKSIDELSQKMKLYNYYKEVYSTVLSEFVGDYSIQTGEDEVSHEPIFEEKYGLKAFSPIAKTFPYQHYDDFGASRSYGYSRPHLGHDMMAATGTPVVAIESGIVETMGWNQYGGWRVGIRSFDKKRYYYYAHLRKDKPYHEGLSEGKIVKAGDVIGYVGRTGYSPHENVNNIETSHLHVGLELIFDESQKECDNEIWIDLYSITALLYKNQSSVQRNNQTKEYYRQFDFNEPSLINFN